MKASTVGIVSGLGAAAFIGYCVYFDHKRRSHPDFKKKLKEKRKLQHKKDGGAGDVNLPDLSDQEAVQRFFLQEVQLGEQLLSEGAVESGVSHLAMAVAVCGQPQALLGVLQQTIPPQVYALLLQNLVVAQRKVRSHAVSSIPGLRPTASSEATLGTIEDLE